MTAGAVEVNGRVWVQPVPVRFACTYRFCVSGLTVEHMGDYCPECRGVLIGEELAHCQALARQGKEWNQMAGGF